MFFQHIHLQTWRMCALNCKTSLPLLVVIFEGKVRICLQNWGNMISACQDRLLPVFAWCTVVWDSNIIKNLCIPLSGNVHCSGHAICGQKFTPFKGFLSHVMCKFVPFFIFAQYAHFRHMAFMTLVFHTGRIKLLYTSFMISYIPSWGFVSCVTITLMATLVH